MYLKIFRLAVIGGAFLVAAHGSRAAVVTISAQRDAMIFANSAGVDTNNASGRGPLLGAGTDGSLNKKRSLIDFDVAGVVPVGAHITNSILTLYLSQIAGGGTGGTGGNTPSRTFSLYDLQQDWGEGSSGSPTNPSVVGAGQGYPRLTGDSSWDYGQYDSTNTTVGKWNAGAGDLHGGNFTASPSSSSTFTSFVVNAPFTWSSTGLTSDIQSWLDSPAANHGWMLKADNGLNTTGGVVSLENTSQSFLGFWSRDGAAANNNPAIAPVLTVTYSVPEPTGWGILFSGIAMLGRRRCRVAESRVS